MTLFDEYKQAIESMQHVWRISRFSFLVYYTDMARFFRNTPDASNTGRLQLMQCYLSSSKLAQWWFKSSLKNVQELSAFHSVQIISRELFNTELLTVENLDAVLKSSDPNVIRSNLSLLKTVGFANQANFNAMVESPYLTAAMGGALSRLIRNKLISLENIEAVLHYPCLPRLNNILDFLSDRKCLNQAGFNWILAQDSEMLSRCIVVLWDERLLTRANFDRLLLTVDQMCEMVLKLKENTILTQSSFEYISELTKTENAFDLNTQLQVLKESSLLNSQNFVALLAWYADETECHIENKSNLLLEIQQNNGLTQPVFNLLTGSNLHMKRVFFKLQEEGCLNQETIDVMVREDGSIREIFLTLQQDNLLNQSTIEAVLSHPQPLDVNPALLALKNNRWMLAKLEAARDENVALPSDEDYLLDQEDVMIILKYPNLREAAQVLYILRGYGIKDPSSLDAVLAHEDYLNATHAIITLNKANLLNERNWTEVLASADLYVIGVILRRLYCSGCLTQSNLDNLLAPEQAFLRSKEADEVCWARLPACDEVLTPVVWRELIDCGHQDNPIEGLKNYVAHLLEQFIGIINHSSLIPLSFFSNAIISQPAQQTREYQFK